MGHSLRILSESQVRDLYEPVAGWESVAAAYREFGRSPDVQSRPSVMTMGPPLVPGQDTRVQFRVKGASVPICDATGAFLYTAGHSYMYLWSINKGVPIGLVALDWLSKRRVALTAAVGIAELGRRDIDKIVLFGAGPWARQTCEVLAEQWPEADVVVVTAHPENSVAFAATMPDNVVAGVDARSGMRGADAAVTLDQCHRAVHPRGLPRAGRAAAVDGQPARGGRRRPATVGCSSGRRPRVCAISR